MEPSWPDLATVRRRCRSTAETGRGALATNHRTPAVHGGCVKVPSYANNELIHPLDGLRLQKTLRASRPPFPFNALTDAPASITTVNHSAKSDDSSWRIDSSAAGLKKMERATPCSAKGRNS